MKRRPRRTEFLVFGSPLVTENEINAVENVLRSCWIGTGPRVAEFEDLFRDYVGSQYAIAVNSCTAALHLAMVASGIGRGDEVIVPAMTFCATANAVVHTGAVPVFADVGFSDGCIDPQDVEKRITPRTKAIIPVHFAGRPCNMEALKTIADRHGLLLIEDAAHAIESSAQGKKIGAIGDMTCFSFYVTKNLYTGEGGMITTNDEELAAKIKTYALHGMTKDAWRRFSDEGYRHYQVVFPGFKYNMTDMQAALGVSQFPRIDQMHSRRSRINEVYTSRFKDLPIKTPTPVREKDIHAYHLYPIFIDEGELGCTRDMFMDALFEENIGTGVHYIALHLQPYYRDLLGCRPDDYPNAKKISDQTLSLPLSAKLSDEDVDDVVAAVERTVDRYSR